MSDLLQCSYCRRYNTELRKLIAGPGAYICDDDVARAIAHVRPAESDEKCAFCGKLEREWIYGRETPICDECLRLCSEIIDEAIEPVTPEEDDPVVARYLAEIDGHPQLTDDQEGSLWARVAEGDASAKGAIVQAYLRDVVPVAQSYRSSGKPLLELIQEGNLGLMRAVDKFDPAMGFAFRTYAVWWIRQAIQSALALGPTPASSREPATIGGPRCPSCREPLAEALRTQIVDVPSVDDGPSARVLLLFCVACGTCVDDVILPGE